MDFEIARHNMVESQVRPNQVTDPGLIAALSEIPREEFVPETMASVAYVDEAINVGDGRYLMEPMILARLLQESEISSSDLVLVVGCGAGYAAAVVGRLAGTVVALEENVELAATATLKLAALEIDNAAVVTGKLTEGWKDQAPYDVIIMAGGVAQVPGAISAQLADGGRLALVTMGSAGLGCGVIVTNIGGINSPREFMNAGTPLLPGFGAAPEFQF